ncbi:MAG: hypothetical protein RRA35_01640 [Desulfomonilia bacterium]|nr:hypothetical protein [Desulfomonilia bacterium]
MTEEELMASHTTRQVIPHPWILSGPGYGALLSVPETVAYTRRLMPEEVDCGFPERTRIHGACTKSADLME